MENEKSELPPLSLPSSDHTIPIDVNSPPSTWQRIGDESPNQPSRPLPTQHLAALGRKEFEKIGEPFNTWQPTMGERNPNQPSSQLPTKHPAALRRKELEKIGEPFNTWQPTIGDERPNQPSRPLPTQHLAALGRKDFEKIGEPFDVNTWQPTMGDGNPYQPSRRRPSQKLRNEPFEDYIARTRNKLKNEERERSSRPSTTSAYGGGVKSSQPPAVGGGEGSYRPSLYGSDASADYMKSLFGGGEGSYQRRPTGGYEGLSGGGEESSQRHPTGLFGEGGYEGLFGGRYETSSQRSGLGDDAYARYIAAARRDEKRKGYQPATWRPKSTYGDGEGSQYTSSDEDEDENEDEERSKYTSTFAARNKTNNEGVIRRHDRPFTMPASRSKVNSKVEDYINSVKSKLKNEESTGTRFDPEIIKRFSNYDLPNDLPIPAAAAKVEKVVDPDGESSSLCSGCKLPIFSTPSISVSHAGNQLFLHEQCATLPPQWLHELHPKHALLLHNQLDQEHSTPANCDNCTETCGTLFYQCPNRKCDFRLDLLCVVQIKIIHRSHRHTLTAIRQGESDCLTCSACDTKHDFLVPLAESQKITLSYLCHLCGFWIHPDCASLPNAILHYQDHQHSLFLTYNPPNPTLSKCFLCSQTPKKSSGVYFCLKCPNYLVHIKCTRKSPSTFKPVFIRDAKVSDLARLPLPNENTSLIPYLRQDVSDGDAKCEETLHPHPLILNKIDESPGRVCNACVQSIVAPPFYSCSTCPDFYLHSCCAKLSTTIKHPIHEHHLSLSPKAPKSDISAGFTCRSCQLLCNGFAYSCKACDDFSLDVACAMINPAITHESHKSTHILFMTTDIKPGSDEICNCCKLNLKGICYECSICRNFKLHVRCALLPKTIRHSFDEHPLQLTTANHEDDDDDEDEYLCEVCEEHIERVRWYYSCSECNQSFHVDCIPSVDRLFKIKLGCTVRIDCHGCPLALVRETEAVWGGSRCRICRELLKSCGDGLAYECSKCFYGMHQNCAEKYLLKL